MHPHQTPVPPHPAARVWAMLTGGLLVIAVLTMALSQAPYYRRLLTPCPIGPCPGSALTVAEAATLTSYGVGMPLYATTVFLLQLIVNTGYLAIAVVLFRRHRHDPMILCTVALLAMLPITLSGYLTVVVDPYGPARLLFFLAIIGFNSVAMLFFALFPSGTFVPRFMRWLAPGLITTDALIVLRAVREGPLALNHLSFLIIETVWMLSAIGAQIYRYLRVSDAEARRQTRWLLAILSIYLGYRIVLGWFSSLTGAGGTGELPLPTGALFVLLHMLELMTLAGIVAMLREGMYNLDRLAGRTVVYTLLTLCIVALYVVLVGGLSVLLRPADNALVALLATGVIAVAAHPLREALQRNVNRLIYGRRDDPREVFAALGRQLEGALAADVVLPTIVRTVARELKLPYAAIVLDDRDDPAAAAVGAPAEPLLILPLSASGAVIGRLFVAARAPNEAFTLNERLLLEDLARQAGVAVRAARLNHELQRSRERLVAAREEERRRLQRDLHDELGPTLAGLSMQLDAARASLAADPAAGEVLLAEVQAQLREAVSTVRRIVHQLRPPLLDQLGLLGAIRETALRLERNSGMTVRLELPEALPLLSAAVEAAAYSIVAEALTNTARHAGAGCCIIRVTLETMLQIEVADDGTGVSEQAVAGVGLRSMRERAEELGGTWTLTATASGTLIRARLPFRP